MKMSNNEYKIIFDKEEMVKAINSLPDFKIISCKSEEEAYDKAMDLPDINKYKRENFFPHFYIEEMEDG
jgi:hypothetical protein